MSLPDARRLYEATEATWPPARLFTHGPWQLREGRGGGQRVGSATAAGPFKDGDIANAEATMRDLGQPPLFMIRDGEAALDTALAARGYRIKDPVLLYVAPVAALASDLPPRLSTFAIWPPLAIMAELWAQGGIGPERVAVMQRTAGPKTAILARNDDRAAGCAYVGLDRDIAMIHALEVTPAQRRKGAASNLMRAAALWASAQKAHHLALAVTEANIGANALYSGMGMTVVGRYHYRIRTED